MLKIDVIIPVYNKAEYLAELVNLLLSRQDLYDKIILIDDCSTDSSAVLIRNFEENFPHKIVAFFQPQNQGPHYARIKGASLSDKKFLMFVDADDLISLIGLQNFLVLDLDWDKFGVCFGHTIKLYDGSTKRGSTKMSTFNIKKLTKPIELLTVQSPTMSGIIVRKDVVHLMSISEDCSWGEDIVFYVKALMFSPFIYINETIGIYRIIEGTRGTSGGTLVKRISFLKLLRSSLSLKKTFSNYVFFILMSGKMLLAWCFKKIR